MTALPKPLCVAIQGARGAFSEEAVRKLVACPYKIHEERTFAEMFSAVARNQAHLCIAPMENSLVGSIYPSYDLLLRYRFRVRGEVYLRIEHCLIAPLGTYLQDVRRVYSHPIALDQCQEFFRRNPRMEAISTFDTAGSVEMIVESGTGDAAAVAGRGAAEHYGGKVLKAGIEDDPANYTRFFLLGRDDARMDGLSDQLSSTATGPPKTSIVFHIENAPGVLFTALEPFARRGIDLTRIESRPIRGKPFDYVFYLDFAGSPVADPVREAMEALESAATFFRVLGTYPSGRLDWVGAQDHPRFLRRVIGDPADPA